jgi:type II secretion system protein I
MNKDERGFTLVELLVSLAILTIALAVLFASISSALERTRQNRDEALASSLVQSLLVRAQNDPSSLPGEKNGWYSEGYRWQIRIRPYGDDGDTKAWRASAYVIRATVYWSHGGQEQSRALFGLRIVPRTKS